jgi:hypothetical protein
MIGELEPDGCGVDEFHGGDVLLASQRHDVVTGDESTAGVPVRRLGRIHRRPAAEDGDHRTAAIGVEKMSGSEDGVVEVR